MDTTSLLSPMHPLCVGDCKPDISQLLEVEVSPHCNEHFLPSLESFGTPKVCEGGEKKLACVLRCLVEIQTTLLSFRSRWFNSPSLSFPYQQIPLPSPPLLASDLLQLEPTLLLCASYTEVQESVRKKKKVLCGKKSTKKCLIILKVNI